MCILCYWGIFQCDHQEWHLVMHRMNWFNSYIGLKIHVETQMICTVKLSKKLFGRCKLFNNRINVKNEQPCIVHQCSLKFRHIQLTWKEVQKERWFFSKIFVSSKILISSLAKFAAIQKAKSFMRTALVLFANVVRFVYQMTYHCSWTDWVKLVPSKPLSMIL